MLSELQELRIKCPLFNSYFGKFIDQATQENTINKILSFFYGEAKNLLGVENVFLFSRVLVINKNNQSRKIGNITFKINDGINIGCFFYENEVSNGYGSLIETGVLKYSINILDINNTDYPIVGCADATNKCAIGAIKKTFKNAPYAKMFETIQKGPDGPRKAIVLLATIHAYHQYLKDKYGLQHQTESERLRSVISKNQTLPSPKL